MKYLKNYFQENMAVHGDIPAAALRMLAEYNHIRGEWNINI